MAVKQEGNYTRKQLIEDCVRSYIRNNPEEYNRFLSQLALRRAKLFDQKFGQLKTIVKGRVKADEDNMRLAFSLPSKLMNAIRTLLNVGDNKPFGEENGEMAWFGRKFPEFRIPNKY